MARRRKINMHSSLWNIKDDSKILLRFLDIKADLISALEKTNNCGIAERVTLIDGFFNAYCSMEIIDDVILGGSGVPLIMLLGLETGRVYFFALKAILKDLEF